MLFMILYINKDNTCYPYWYIIFILTLHKPVDFVFCGSATDNNHFRTLNMVLSMSCSLGLLIERKLQTVVPNGTLGTSSYGDSFHIPHIRSHSQLGWCSWWRYCFFLITSFLWINVIECRPAGSCNVLLLAEHPLWEQHFTKSHFTCYSESTPKYTTDTTFSYCQSTSMRCPAL